MLRKAAGLVLALVCWACGASGPAPDSEWLLYKQAYISPQGRVIDTGNAGISHSEGQGMGLLLAAHYRDRAVFESLWRWTRENLYIRGDKLAAWKWVPGPGGGSVTDRNNATDGDLFIAWALYRAGRQWNDASYLQAGREISRDIRAKLMGNSTHGPVLLPGEQGFVKPDSITVNLSYWVFPALQELNQLDPAPEWSRWTETGLNLLKWGRFGRWQLPPDWLRLSDKPEISPDHKPRFGYDAVRIPLYLIWGKLGTPENLKPFEDFWRYFESARFIPAWTALIDDSIDSYDASPGIHAVVSLTRQKAASGAVQISRLPRIESVMDYYSASLILLAKIAALEGAQR